MDGRTNRRTRSVRRGTIRNVGDATGRTATTSSVETGDTTRNGGWTSGTKRARTANSNTGDRKGDAAKRRTTSNVAKANDANGTSVGATTGRNATQISTRNVSTSRRRSTTTKVNATNESGSRNADATK